MANMQPQVEGGRSNGLPLTQGQQLIWSGQQLHPESPLYNMAFMFTLSGSLDADVFGRAFGILVSRCEALRTVIVSEQGVPAQHLLESVADGHQLLDFSFETDPDHAAHSWAVTQCAEPFDLTRRLFDSALIKLGERRHAWFFSQHHVVCDAWSITIIFRELSEIYARLIEGAQQSGPAMPSFADYVAYESQARIKGVAAGYWDQVRSQAPAPVALYGRNPGRVSTRSERVVFELGEERTARLRELAQLPGIRTLSVDLALFNLFATLVFSFLYRVSGQRDLAIGAPAHNRPTPAFKQTVGLFTEVYPLHVALTDGDTFFDLHAKVSAQTMMFLRNALPGASHPGNNAGCNTVLNYINAAFGDFAGEPVQPLWLHSGHKDREHHLRLQVQDFAATGRFTLYFDFNCDAFDRTQRQAAVAHFGRLLDAMLGDPACPIDDVPLLGPAELSWQVDDFNQPGQGRSHGDNVLARIEQQALATPAATALSCAGQSLTYREMNLLASHLAGNLSSNLTDNERVVAVCTRRSIETVVGMLGVMKTGRAYLPLDPDWPVERLALVIEDAGVSTVLVPATGEVRLPQHLRILPIPTGLSDAGTEARDAGSALQAGDLAYVMYTSGSTGKPKGVMIRHASLANYVGWACDHYVRGRVLTFPLFTPLTFDLTVTSVFVPLASGGAIAIYPPSPGQADLALLDVLDDNCVDIVKLTPSHLALIQGRDLRASRIRQLILGGEDFTVALARRAREIFGEHTLLHNEYGPTEGTVGCIVHTFDPVSDIESSVPVGVPIDNMRAYVLDRKLRPLPRGVAGELYIGGVGLADGYLNRPELSAERFVPNPFRVGEMLYRTGDLARFNERSELDYLGRDDHQVKIRGARIELGEIEKVITSHPAVANCVVSVFERDVSGGLSEDVVCCSRCGLPSNYPGASFDEQMVCNQCRAFEHYQDKATNYFQSMDDLQAIFDAGRADRNRDYDCLALLSGGKDSTYMLCRLVDMGLSVLAFTLDNGYISDGAKANIGRVVKTLGVDHVFGSTPAMNAIFVDSLRRHANVCQGCFKTIYTLSVNLARERDIPFIVTGLSRGQFFETRLTEEVFTTPGFDGRDIDESTMLARKAYHRVDDAANRLLDVEVFKDDDVFEKVRFIDFYRYCAADLQAMLDYLDRRVAWVRPADTGRSTNCLINDVGIFMHQRQRGYHNYALPYSWDVRMGHKTREAALAELDDEIDVANVERILQEIGYDIDVVARPGEKRLAAYFTAQGKVATEDLRAWVKSELPDFMLPSHFVQLERIPLSSNGKVDRDRLPPPDAGRPSLEAAFEAPRTPVERQLAEIWCNVLRVDQIGIRDNFFELGGDSIMAIQIVARARRFGLHVLPSQLVDKPTIAALAASLGSTATDAQDAPMPAGDDLVPMPMAHWLFEQPRHVVAHWNHVLRLRPAAGLLPQQIEQGLQVVLDRHEALTMRYRHEAGRWLAGRRKTALRVELRELNAGGDDRPKEDRLRSAAETLHRNIDIGKGRLLAAGLLSSDSGMSELMLVIHHLAVDVVSWSVLLEDLSVACAQIREGLQPTPVPQTASLQRWAAALQAQANSEHARAELGYWQDALGVAGGTRVADSPQDATADNTPMEPLRRSLTAEDTRALLQEVPRTGRISVVELLTAALARTLADADGTSPVRLFLEGHGRQLTGSPLDVSRTLGWFTSLYPVSIPVPGDDRAASWLRDVKEALRRVPSGGTVFGLLRYLSDDKATRLGLVGDDASAVLFNYLGNTDQLSAPDSMFKVLQPLTLHRHPDALLRYRGEVNAMVTGGHLVVDWSHGSRARSSADIERDLGCFLDNVRKLVDAALGSDSSSLSESDFPLANLDKKGLDKLASLLGGKPGKA